MVNDKELNIISIEDITGHIGDILGRHKQLLHPSYQVEEYLFELVEELRFGFTDNEPESMADRAAIYLEKKGINRPLANALSLDMMQSLMRTICGHFPLKRYKELAKSGFIIVNRNTLGIRFD